MDVVVGTLRLRQTHTLLMRHSSSKSVKTLSRPEVQMTAHSYQPGKLLSRIDAHKRLFQIAISWSFLMLVVSKTVM